MTEPLAGRYFLAGSSRCVPARASLESGGTLRVGDCSGTLLNDTPFAEVKVSDRLGNLPRRFDFPGGSVFETDDNAGVDALLMQCGRRGGFVHRLERSWKWAAIAFAIAGVAVYVFVAYGIPAGALWLARETPSSANGIIARQSFQILDRTFLSPSRLDAADAAKAQALFAKVAARGAHGASGYRLVLRNSEKIGPNAFALPDGTVILTDQLWKMVKRDDEIEGVFAHEIAHVDRAHTLQQLYQAALVPAAIAVVTGDLSQISQLAVVVPGLLVQASYSRALEQQADDDAAVTLSRLGGDPAHMADLLERLDAALCKKAGCGPSWLGTHPDTALRAARLRHAAPERRP